VFSRIGRGFEWESVLNPTSLTGATYPGNKTCYEPAAKPHAQEGEEKKKKKKKNEKKISSPREGEQFIRRKRRQLGKRDRFSTIELPGERRGEKR